MRSPANRRVDPRTLRQRAIDPVELFPTPPKPPARKALDVPEDWDDETNPPPKAG